MVQRFGGWYNFIYLCTEEKRAVVLSKGSQNGSHQAVKILLQKCYTTDVAKLIEHLITTS